jgi:predicted RND superfamily exporter protein
MSTPSVTEDRGVTETIAGLLAALALFVSLIGVAYRPARLIPFAIALALISTAMGGRHSRLAAAALVVCGLCFMVGMAVAVSTDNPIF